MNFKNPQRHMVEFFNLDPMMRLILSEAEWYLWNNFGLEPTITCLYRNEEEQRLLVEAGQAKDLNSVHCDHRGADLRIFENNNVNLALESFINRMFIYDDTRPTMKTCLIHDGTARHIHFQCRPTKKGQLGQ